MSAKVHYGSNDESETADVSTMREASEIVTDFIDETFMGASEMTEDFGCIVKGGKVLAVVGYGGEVVMCEAGMTLRWHLANPGKGFTRRATEAELDAAL